MRPGAAGIGDATSPTRCLLLPVENPLDAGRRLLPASHRRFQTFFHQPLTKMLDRADRDAVDMSGLLIAQLLARLGLINRQQKVGVTHPIRRPLANADDLLQTGLFLGFQPNDVLFCADPPRSRATLPGMRIGPIEPLPVKSIDFDH